jgi:4-hydroxy-4-methyl-2-oxoglutarate aldolase
VSQPVSAAALQALRRLDSCAVANAIETFDVRLRNEGFTDGRIRCMFEALPSVVGYAVTARIRCSTPPPVGHAYLDRTDWWTYIQKVPAPRIVVVEDIDERPGLGAFVGEVHANILRAIECEAVVTNGSVRDLPAVRECGLQLFAGSVSPSHAFVHMVDFGQPVSVGGLAVESGALLLGDRHGVVLIPPGLAESLPAKVVDMRAKEREVIEISREKNLSIDRLRAAVKGIERWRC